MNSIHLADLNLLIGLLLLLLAQIGCLFARKVWVRLIPTAVTVALMVFCVGMYACSDWTNWAWLILLFLLFCLLMAMGLVWLVYGLIRLVPKRIKKHEDCQ